MVNRKYVTSCSILAISIALSACGGGSPAPAPRASQPTVPTIPTTTTPSSSGTATAASFQTTEYNADWSLAAINADQAYARGFTGAGAIIGFVDFGFLINNSEVNWHPNSMAADQQWIDVYDAFLGQPFEPTYHGHWVSSIAAAKKNDFAIHGVAFDATVIGVDYFSGVDISTQTQGGITYFVSDPWSYVVNQGARVVSKSIGYDEEDIVPNPPAGGTTDVDNDGIAGNEHYVTTDAATVVELGALLIAAAGNDGDPDPLLSNIDTQNLIEQFNLTASGGAFIVAGALNQFGSIASFSDRAGVLQDIYLVAPGEDIAVHHPFFNSQVGFVDGTSFAAPHIAGAAALLFAQWPQLTAGQVADILFTTATDLGAPGTDPIYGRGALNLAAATQPQGITGLALNGITETVAVNQNMLVLGAAFGDAQPSNLNSVMILDSYNRDFYINMNNRVFHANNGVGFDAVLDRDTQFKSSHLRLGANIDGTVQLNTRGYLKTDLNYLPEVAKTQNRVELSAWHLTGETSKTTQWIIGQGRHLSSALDVLTRTNQPTQDLFLSGYKQNYMGAENAFYMGGLFKQNEKTNISFGFITGVNESNILEAWDPQQKGTPFYGFETRITKNLSKGSVSFSVGAILEKETVLGSHSSAGFKLAEQTITGTFNLAAEHSIGKSWRVAASTQIGLSDVRGVSGSLFNGFNVFTSTQWAFSLNKSGLLKAEDQFGVRISQPLRVENAKVSALTASYFDVTTKAPVYETQALNLSPTGREIATEVSYQFKNHGWTVKTNLMHRQNAGHRANLSDKAALIRLSRTF